MLRLAFDFIITWRETRTRPNAYATTGLPPVEFDALLITFKYHWDEIALFYSGG